MNYNIVRYCAIIFLISGVIIVSYLWGDNLVCFLQDEERESIQEDYVVTSVSLDTHPSNTSTVLDGKSVPYEEFVPKEKIDTSDWKTYRNEEYGFELKYTPTWNCADKITENINGCVFLDPSHPESFGNIWIYVVNVDDTNKIDLSEELRKSKGEKFDTIIPEEPNYIIAGTKGIMVTYDEIDKSYNKNLLAEGKTVVFVKNKKLFFIVTHAGGEIIYQIDSILSYIIVD